VARHDALGELGVLNLQQLLHPFVFLAGDGAAGTQYSAQWLANCQAQKDAPAVRPGLVVLVVLWWKTHTPSGELLRKLPSRLQAAPPSHPRGICAGVA
jgi:hypothetical protein